MTSEQLEPDMDVSLVAGGSDGETTIVTDADQTQGQKADDIIEQGDKVQSDSVMDTEGEEGSRGAGSDDQGDMVREMGDGEEEPPEIPSGEPPGNRRDVGDGQEEELNKTADNGQDEYVSGDVSDELQDDVKSTLESQSVSLPDEEHPSVVPAVDDVDSGRNSQTETTDAEKLEEVKVGSIRTDRLVEGQEGTNQDNKVSSATAALGTRTAPEVVPAEDSDRDQTEMSSVTVKMDQRQVMTTTSDYSGSVRRHHVPVFRSAHAHVQCLQAPHAVRAPDLDKHVSRSRIPPRLIRLATVTMAPKVKSAIPMPSLYYEEPRRPRKIITWDQANNSRPPLRIDMEGPTPWSYSPRNKPLNETNAPSWTFGSRCSPEREGGSRTSWAKTWFQSPHVWHNKVDFTSDTRWPSPNAYTKASLLGPRQRTMPEYPSFTMGRKGDFSFVKAGADKEPSPIQYDRRPCDRVLFRSTPSFTHQFRREGTILWSPGEDTPGPGAYSPTTSCNHPHRPAYSIKGIRREKSHVLGPYSTF